LERLCKQPAPGGPEIEKQKKKGKQKGNRAHWGTQSFIESKKTVKRTEEEERKKLTASRIPTKKIENGQKPLGGPESRSSVKGA